MKHIVPAAATLRVSVIIGHSHLTWPSLRLLLEGLNGVLAPGGIYVDAGHRQEGHWGLKGLMSLERRVLPGCASVPVAAGCEPLPGDPAQLPECDVLVDFRAAPASDALAARARHGVLQCTCHNSSAVLAAVMGGAGAVDCMLLCRKAGEREPRRVAIAAVQTKFSAAQSQAFASEKSVLLMLRELRRLAATGSMPGTETHAAGAGRAGLAGLPRYGRRAVRKLYDKYGVRLLSDSPRPFGLRVGRGSLLEFDPASGVDIPRAPRTFCADPFLIARPDGIYCFYEEYLYGVRRGHITVARLTADGAEVIGPALKTSYHLSFPYLFEHEGELFMMPETLQAGRIEIWRCTEFPLKWERHATALEGQMLGDPVLYRQEDGWWLFANSCHDSFGDFSSELSLFRISGPGLEWIEPHPLNPVVVGSDTARGGGRVFEQDGRLYRYSQDNSGRVYGYGLNLMEITELSPERYSERRVRHVTPAQIPGAIGCHHADAAGGLFVMDVRWP